MDSKKLEETDDFLENCAIISDVAHGYHSWIISSKGYSRFCAFGGGGQYIRVIPDLNIVVVLTSYARGHNPQHKSVADEFIIPSILKP